MAGNDHIFLSLLLTTVAWEMSAGQGWLTAIAQNCSYIIPLLGIDGQED
ncbi:MULTISPECIES: hypothetical protein [Spirulina sp. CCY15215]|nr:hypothetical protein [Spirulina major]